MYYSRPFSAAQNTDKYDTRHALKDFDFTRLIDFRNVPVLKLVDAREFTPTDFTTPTLGSLHGRKALFDFAAAVMTQLHYRSYIKTDDVLREVNEFFHQSLIQSGYVLRSRPEIEFAEMLQNVEVVVPGAQTRSISISRVDAAIHMLKELPFQPEQGHAKSEVHVTFTGRCPEHGGRILNEAGDMILYFREHLHELPESLKIHIHREDAARNTRENLSHSVTRSDSPPREKSHFVFISSLFHLPRLARETEDVLTDSIASRITLVSSQRCMSKPEMPASHEAGYFKSAMFEFLQQLLSDAIQRLPDRPGYG